MINMDILYSFLLLFSNSLQVKGFAVSLVWINENIAFYPNSCFDVAWIRHLWPYLVENKYLKFTLLFKYPLALFFFRVSSCLIFLQGIDRSTERARG